MQSEEIKLLQQLIEMQKHQAETLKRIDITASIAAGLLIADYLWLILKGVL